MARICTLSLAILAGLYCVAQAQDNNGALKDPCADGKMFGLICDIMRTMDANTKRDKQALDSKFENMVNKQGKLNKQTKEKLNREKQNLQAVHDEDVAKLKMKLAQNMESMKEQMNFNLNRNNRELTNQTASLRQRHIAEMKETKTEITKKLSNSTATSRNRLSEVESEIDKYANDFRRKLTSDMVTIQGDVDKKYGIMRIQANNDILQAKRDLVSEIRSNYRKFEDMRRELNQLKGRFEQEPTWPHGKYCILANGKCPTGFLRVEGYLKAIAMKSAGVENLGQAQFGSSDIRCHGTECGQFKPWAAEFNMVSCCKN